MTSNSKIQVDYTTKTKNFQLVFPINFEINIPADDSVRLITLSCMERILEKRKIMR